MADHKHILDDLVERINKATGKEIKVYLAVDEEEVEFLFFKTEKVERGIPLEGVVHAYGRFRMYAEDTEEKALARLTENISDSIKQQVVELEKAMEAAAEPAAEETEEAEGEK
jgi:hypothetical protein